MIKTEMLARYPEKEFPGALMLGLTEVMLNRMSDPELEELSGWITRIEAEETNETVKFIRISAAAKAVLAERIKKILPVESWR